MLLQWRAPRRYARRGCTSPIERFLLLTPGGPLVVETSITIDGQPFHEAREKLVDEVLKLATDKEGKSTWAQVMANSRRLPGQAQSFANDEYRKVYLENMDVNKDGLLDRYEARRMVAQGAGGGDFVLSELVAPGSGVVQQGRNLYSSGNVD